jgi:hypothetical protein
MEQLVKKNVDSLLELDIHKVEVSQHGVEDFYWPVSYSDREAACNDLLKGYTELIRKYDEGEGSVLSYKLLSKYLITEVISVFNGELLQKRIGQDNYVPACKEEWRIWSALFNGTALKMPAFMDKFRQGPFSKNKKTKFRLLQKVKKAASLISLKKGGFGVGNLKLKPVTQSVLEGDVIATQRSDLIQKHSQIVREDVVFCRSDKWFSSVSEQEMAEQQLCSVEQLEIDIISHIHSIYNKYDISLTDPVLSHFKDIISQGSALIRVHYNRLLLAPQTLPRKIWTGTGGYIWDAILRNATLFTLNGKATGHDHGAGLGHVDNPVMGLSEFWGCTDFICLNNNQGTEMSNRASSWHHLDKSIPNIRGIKGSNQSQYTEHAKFLTNTHKTKTIIVLATLYGGDRVWMGPCSPDVVHVDWQARLIGHLREWGYNVILKVHPETPVMPPEALEKLGAVIRKEPLEDMMSEGDMVLFDCLYTSVFRSVISTNIPMVLVDFYGHPWTNKAKGLVEKRIGFLSGKFDEQNKKDVDWDALKEAIEHSGSKCNNAEFFEYYYG